MAKAKGKTANIFVWIILFLLIVGLAGFGVDGFLGGQVRSIGKVGDRDIPVQDYARALQQEMRAIEAELGQGMSFDEARGFGVDRAVLAQMVTIAALENEAMQLGISVGDAMVQRELLAQPAFRGISGQFDRETYRFILQSEGMSESDFEERLRLETARGLLQTAVVAGIPAPQVQADALYGYLGERRSFDVIALDRSALESPIPAPDDADLQAFHQENIGQFTRPAAREITYAWITPDMLMDQIEVDEEALQALYDMRRGEFVQPERRLVERLIMPDMASAEAALARIAAGEVDFADIVAERGLTLEDADMGDVTRDQLGGEAGEGVFALAEPGVAGPFTTPLGPAIFRMNAILAAQEVSLEDARAELSGELLRDRAGRMIAEQYDDFADLLAGGAEIEDLAAETDMVLGQISYRPDARDGIAAHAEFREAAEDAAEGDFPEVLVLENGGLFALRLDAETPPAPIPFDEAVVRVIEAWEAAQLRAALAETAAGLLTALEAGTAPADLGHSPDRVEGITRNDFLPGMPRELVSEVFAMAPGTFRTVEGDAVVYVLHLTDVLEPLTGTAETERLKAILAEQVAQGLAQDVFAYFSRALEAQAGIRLNEQALTAVHNQMR